LNRIPSSRRGRKLVVGVGLVTLALLGVSRFVSRVVQERASASPGGGAVDGVPGVAEPQAAAALPDFSFYHTLGDAPVGRKGASPDASLRLGPGDLSSGSGVFVVQVLATGDEAQAKQVRDSLARRGFPAAAIEDDSGTGVLWRVRVGRWKERASAETTAEKIRTETGLEAWVLREAGR
jgi:cell division septation protein DedD